MSQSPPTPSGNVPVSTPPSNVPVSTPPSNVPVSHGSAPNGDLGFELPPPAVVSRARIVALGGILAIVLVGVFLGAYLPRRKARAALEEGVRSAEGTATRVEVVTPKIIGSDRPLTLPGSVQALEETTIYPRTNGYVKAWLVDIGDKVTEGQLLAEIDIPENVQERSQARAQLAQARAQLEQARANRDFSASTLKRYEALASNGVASQQDLEQKRGQAKVDEATVGVAESAVRAQQANVERLSEIAAFAKITAPFAGTITERRIQRGMLVTPGMTTPLFKLASTDPVRVLVAVPQNVAPSVKSGQKAQVAVREYPGKPFEGTVARTAGALDSATRTMTTEVRVPNPEGKLLTGMYADVSLQLSVTRKIVEIPSTALFSDSKGLRVAVIDGQNKVRFVAITIDRDTGPTLQIAAGLDGSERVVKLANVELTEGMGVETFVAPPPSATASAGPAPTGSASAK